MQYHYHRTINSLLLDKQLDQFISRLTSVCDTCIPKLHKKSNGKHKIASLWFSYLCQRAIRRRKAAERKCHHPFPSTPHNIISYKQAEAQAQKSLQIHKRTAWHKHCQSFKTQTLISTIWKKIKAFQNLASYPSNLHLKIHGRITNDPRVISDALSNALFTPSMLINS